MQFDSFSAFLAMGGYGFYVWLSYGISALLLIILVIASNKQNKAVIDRILARQKREIKLRNAASQQSQQQISASASVNNTEDEIKKENDSNEVLS
ncbi:MAG: heme exporter protein D [Alteromonadaceae bacterium]|jgi:heme exporter protein D|tara:strand:- start:664 stop:948 length:285 start_codon:yes stop_codon:yes gene_type:complete